MSIETGNINTETPPITTKNSDWYLQELVNLANYAGLEMGITLTMGGSIVSGMLISGKRYFEIFADQFSESWPHEDKESIRQSFARHGSIYDTTNDEQTPPPQYIHLRDARFHSPAGILPTNHGMIWRGKINSVSGFSLGLLSAN